MAIFLCCYTYFLDSIRVADRLDFSTHDDDDDNRLDLRTLMMLMHDDEDNDLRDRTKGGRQV